MQKKRLQLLRIHLTLFIDKYVIMPNHIHFILIKNDLIEERATARVATTVTVGRIVGAYKSVVANEWLKICKQSDEVMGKIWQRNYYEHVIRDENDYQIKWNYIEDNPIKWAEDEYYYDKNINAD